MLHESFEANGDGPSGDLREGARRLFELGRSVWPQLAVAPEAFERYFARHAGAGDLAPRDAYAADMYLACASACGMSQALALVEETLAGDVARAVASIDPSRTFVEETLQNVREKLFVGRSQGGGKIIEYGGRGSLKGWLCAVAVRAAIAQRRRRGEQRHELFAERDDRRLARGGPEFEYLHRRYKEAFEDAVRSAIEHLGAKERMLLRLNLVEGMSVDKLGALYGVGRSTAARWLAGARSALFEQARGELRAKLGLSSTELDALAGDIRSQLDVSILRLLGS